mmetsp:Transcript_4920/g.13784  ORF Transcript_4920/g.13784 Transcript_4920/m.13784 type:complete len:319 (+) Transcript_4920:295-1251(+)
MAHTPSRGTMGKAVGEEQQQPATALVQLLRPDQNVAQSKQESNGGNPLPARPSFADLLSPKPTSKTFAAITLHKTPPPSTRKHPPSDKSPRTPPPMPRRRPRPPSWRTRSEERIIQSIPDPLILSCSGHYDDDDIETHKASHCELLESLDEDDEDEEDDDIWSRLCLPDPPRPTLCRRRRRDDAAYDSAGIVSTESSVEDGVCADSMLPPAKRALVSRDFSVCYRNELEHHLEKALALDGKDDETSVGPRLPRNISGDDEYIRSPKGDAPPEAQQQQPQWICPGGENDKLIRLIEVEDDDEEEDTNSNPMEIDEHWSN